MRKSAFVDNFPDILGLKIWPGCLVVVGSTSYKADSDYIIGNCIVDGVKGDMPVAYFAPACDALGIYCTLAEKVKQNESLSQFQLSARISDYQLFVDTAPNLTIEYLVERIFYLVKSYDIRMVVVDTIQKVDGDIFLDESCAYLKEIEMIRILDTLKAIARNLNLVVIVSSEMTSEVMHAKVIPTTKDLLYMSTSSIEDLCDEIIIIDTWRSKLILPIGTPVMDDSRRQGIVINVVYDHDRGCFKKAESLSCEDGEDLPEFEEAQPDSIDTPMYTWYVGYNNNLYFDFYDSDSNVWSLEIDDARYEQCRITLLDRYEIEDEEVLGIISSYDDIEIIKDRALDLARIRFPSVEIFCRCGSR